MDRKEIMSSLTNLCLQTIAESIENAPPMIQEMIINETKENIKKSVIKETVKEMKILSSIVPSISKSIILTRANFNENPDYYEIYSSISKHVVKLAIEIAEANVYEMNKSFNILSSVSANARYRFYISGSEDETESDEYNDTQYQSDSN
jgi:hypothetical protein